MSVFSRIATTRSDRNLVDFYFDSEIVFSGVLPGRPDDKFGASFIYVHISDQARALDRDIIAFWGVNQALRDYEMTFELSYQAQIVPGWAAQPLNISRILGAMCRIPSRLHRPSRTASCLACAAPSSSDD